MLIDKRKAVSGVWVWGTLSILLIISSVSKQSHARNNIRDAFFNVYPNAVGTMIETLPSQSTHCGVCHYSFTGGGTRNPYGDLLEAAMPNFGNNKNGKRQAVQSIEDEDPDGDGFSTVVEVTDLTTFSNTPTFPGLTPTNLASVTDVDKTEIQTSLIPSSGSDTTPPSVTVIVPNGGETYVANNGTTVQWIAGDVSGVAGLDLYVSLDNGATYKLIAVGLSNTESHTWFPANRPTTQAIFRVVAIDNSFNEGYDDSDAVFTIQSPVGGIAPTTLRDFDQPGSQPFEAGILNPPEACAVCHSNYGEPNVEPYNNWSGSMMAQASIDPLFKANMAIANQDAPDSGDMCLRCHLYRGWSRGRSVPTDGSAMLATDESGVACDLCHRLVDPIFDPTENPAEDEDILAALSFPASTFGNGTATIDPTGARRGPFVNANTGHPVLVSPFHREAALCGTCHDVSNPAFEKDGNGNYMPNAFDAPATDFSAHTLLPVERTYSEWFYSQYNTPEGVYAPQFGGNRDFVATCQDCHMKDVSGHAADPVYGPPSRDDLPLHDMTGGSTWLAGLMPAMFPGQVDEAAMQAGITRARYMLQNAADLATVQQNSNLKVTVTNNCGHKLPTGYPEGRRMWINVKFFDDANSLIAESGAYDPNTGVLSHDSHAKIYHIEPGIDPNLATILGMPSGPSLHFVLNNKVYLDNRIPPRGFTNAAYADFGGAPADYNYPDGQYWDDTYYHIPVAATSAKVTLYYQSTSKEFVEFLRDENTTNNDGNDVYNLWNDNGKCPPELMETNEIALTLQTDLDGIGGVDFVDFSIFASYWGNDCAVDCGPANLDGIGGIGLEDLAIFTETWLWNK
ncbi:MAG: multiheme c-type cytochrome [Planctomycetota bacterium]